MFKNSPVAHSVWRGAMSLVAFSIPFLLMQMPVEWQSMTLGSVLMALAHFAEKKLTS